ncbi:hypothetical protein [uncultured Limimaricola sp.]|uniref:hypothetical protein n=1 Tax=uncultured Limimaricola sp. TaxID=2211667 RepID=UPI0030F51688
MDRALEPAQPDRVSTAPRPLKLVVLGGDATNPTLILRIRSFLRAGAGLTAFTFRRHKYNTEFQPEWENIHLGETVDRNYLNRLPRLMRAIRRLWHHRDRFRHADAIYARQIDLLALALIGKWLSGSRAKVVYEVEDIQAVYFRADATGALFRATERLALRFVNLLVPLSPGFLSGFYGPVMRYTGPSFVLENKIQPGELTGRATSAGRAWEEIKDRWVIGWFGTLRCPTSMALLENIAERLGPKVEIYTRGYPTETGLAAYMKIVDRHPNWTYDGEYTIPEDLEQMYGRVHFSWCLDLLDEHGNSQLLRACRVYQGGYYGAVPLVMEGTEMDRWLGSAGIGHAFAPPYDAPIAHFLEHVDPAAYCAERQQVMKLRDALFLEDGREARALLDTIRALPSQ